MPVTEMVVMVAVFAAVALSLIHLLRLVGTIILHRTIRRVVEVDPASALPLLDSVAAPGATDGDSRLSVILIATGIAMVAASIVIGDPGWMHYGVAAALFPLIVGTALWIRLYFLERNRRGGLGE